MNYILPIAIIAIVVYVLIAARLRLWPWPVKDSTTTPGGSQAALMATLVHVTPSVPGAFPEVHSLAPLSADVRQGIIDGFTERIATAKTKGWTQGLEPADYTIYVFPSVRDFNADGIYSPVFKVFFEPGSPYDNSIYDQDPNAPGGWTFAAEQVLTDGRGTPTNEFVIAQNDQREYTTRATSNGLDHLFLYYNDRPEYERTKTHESGINHPLW